MAASETVEYLVSGGQDYTMRVWAREHKGGVVTGTYGLRAVLHHDEERRRDTEELKEDRAETPSGPRSCPSWPCKTVGVTAVTCIGTQGPFISGTARGGLYVLGLGAVATDRPDWSTKIAQHSMKINDLCGEGGTEGDLPVVGEAPFLGKPWTFLAASEDGTATVVSFRGARLTKTVVLGAPHESPVLKVRCVQNGVGPDLVSYATSTAEAVYLWSAEGHHKHVLKNMWHLMTANGDWVVHVPQEKSMSMLAVSKQSTGSLIFAGNTGGKDGGDSCVSVWNVEGGHLCDAHGRTDGKSWRPEVPVVSYREVGGLLDVDQSGRVVEFAVDVRRDAICLWSLRGVEPGMLAVEPRAPVNWLAAPDEDGTQIELEMDQFCEVTHLCVAEDPHLGGVLVTACDDGAVRMWDLTGPDWGEIAGEMRSLSIVEVMLPLVLLSLTFFQVISFAFGPSIPWQSEVHATMNLTQKIVLVDLTIMIDVPKATIFWPEVCAAVMTILLFLICACTGVPNSLELVTRAIEATVAFESKRHILHLFAVVAAKMLDSTQAFVRFFMKLCATVLVVPIFTKCAQGLDCVHPEGEKGDTWWQIVQQVAHAAEAPEPKPYLAIAPQILCFEGSHRTLVLLLWTLVPMYLVTLIPYAVVEGDTEYMNATKLWTGLSQTSQLVRGALTYGRLDKDIMNVHEWALSANRKATRINMGVLHPNPAYIFRSLFTDLVAKALLSVIVIETTSEPLLQMALVTAVGAFRFLTSVLWPPMAEPPLNWLHQGTRFFTLCAMACGILTVCLQVHSWIPVAILAFFFAVVPTATLVLMWRSWDPKLDVRHYITSEISVAQPKTELELWMSGATSDTGEAPTRDSLTALLVKSKRHVGGLVGKLKTGATAGHHKVRRLWR